jgi:hypothetical protein
VFPIIWIVIFAVIGGALVKIAFFPDEAAESDPAFPTGEIVEPEYVVSLGTVSNDVILSGTVAPDTAVSIPSTLSGEVREVLVSPGTAVSKGQELLKLRAVVQNDDGTSGTDWDIIVSPINGTLSTFTALVGQSFSVGEAIGKVSPSSYSVSGSIPPEQLYRLVERPTEAQVTINGGPAPFTCTGLSISTAAPDESQGGQGETPGGPTVKCRIPAEVTVFPGLTAEIVISGGFAENVLVVPTTAVEGMAGTGNVYFVLPDGTTELRPVTLGLTDGINVEIVEGLAEGDVILQFIPGAPAFPGEGFPGEFPGGECKPTPDGGMVCEG